MPQTPAEQADVPFAVEQALPHRPQFPAVVRMFTSQPLAAIPSQSAKPALQVNPHAPAAHVTVAFALAAHARPQPPQWSTLVTVFVSHPVIRLPSQSAVPAAQLPTEQMPAMHVRVPLGGVGQTLRHTPQLLTSLTVPTSQPSP